MPKTVLDHQRIHQWVKTRRCQCPQTSSKIDMTNFTGVTEFTLEVFTEMLHFQLLTFIVFLCIYTTTVLGNACIILVYILSASLQTPMYFYLANFSFLDICYISATVPKMLSNFLSDKKTISFYGCAVQLYSFGVFGGTECYMLATMAYDRYNAICHPLLYSIIMSRTTCIELLGGSWLIGIVNSFIHTFLTFTLPFCGCNHINHLFCDIPPILKLACTDTWMNQLVVFVFSGCMVVVSFTLTIISYTYIISTILGIRSATGKKKAFSTCSSHLIVVSLFYGSCMFTYLKSNSRFGKYQDKLAAIMYTMIAPLLNPFIYTLRNNDVKAAVLNLYERRAPKNP
ncbi:olfactory receptor 5G25-like [Rhinoderma darwinii]|uniref:olfactory receptor 5G25-like n=1 Tax=Rhinoderma darwinii TaxID=43563 RepID=UPI003F676CBA